MLRRLLLLCCVFVASFTVAQPIQDSFPFSRQKWAKAKFTVENAVLQELQVKWKSARKSRYSVGEGVNDAGRKLFASWIGNASSSQDVTLFLPGEIKTFSDLNDWKVELICPGEMVKSSTRVKNKDGSKSFETERQVHVFWEQGAIGHLIEKEDTISRFAVTVRPLSDSLSEEQRMFLAQSRPASESKKFWTVEMPADRNYLLKGTLRGQPFLICFNGSLYRGNVYLNDTLLGTFQSGLDDGNLLFSKKMQQHQYLLLRKGLDTPGQSDGLRLAALIRFVQSSVTKNSWDWD